MKNLIVLFFVLLNSVCFGQSDLFSVDVTPENYLYTELNSLSNDAELIIDCVDYDYRSAEFYDGRGIPLVYIHESGVLIFLKSDNPDNLHIIYSDINDRVLTKLDQLKYIYYHE